MSDTQEKLNKIFAKIKFKPEFADTHGGCPPAYKGGKYVGLTEAKKEAQALIDSAKREVLEEMRPANATIESMRIYTPRTHTYMGKEYPACGICGFCPEAMNAFIDAQLEQSEESV